MRLVDADALATFIDCGHLNNPSAKVYSDNDIHEMLEAMPTVDAVPVRHGKWIWKGEEGDSRFMCSVCQWKEYVPTCNGVPNIWDYCPSCGADMRGESNDTKGD